MSDGNGQSNRGAIFFASFMTLIAAGVGFGVRGGILALWGGQFGFTNTELGIITGQGLVGFGIVIVLASLITDRIGYKKILLAAFALHVVSAVITIAATPVFAAAGKDGAYWCLLIGMFTFSVANGLCEAVINPLVATMYSNKKTHYLNILHAGWPGGLILGGLVGFCFVGEGAKIASLSWEISWGFFLVPTLIYGLIVLKQDFPISEAREAGVSFGQMIMAVLSPVLLFLFFLHACVGYVELGTDSWITGITNSITGQGFELFIFASAIMFVLRFFAGPIVEKINPIGLLMLSSIIGCTGLLLIANSDSTGMVWVAVGIYGLGKTFLWPTMLGVVGERYPKGGAITMGLMGGIGMLSAGLLGGPGIGYKQDYYASKDLADKSPATYERYAAEDESGFLSFPKIKGLDGQKVKVLTGGAVPGAALRSDLAKIAEQEAAGKTPKGAEDTEALGAWWDGAEEFAETDKSKVKDAGTYGGRMALKWTAIVPAVMAFGYLLLVLYFRSKGGYKQEVLHGAEPDGEHYTGGVEGPVE